MVIVRSDGKQFVMAAGRESLPAVLPRKQKTERLNKYQSLFEAEFACAYKYEGQLEVVFGHNGGYSLSDIVRDHLGTKGRFIWTEALPDDQNGHILVVLDKGKILNETVLTADGELDSLLLMQLFGEDEAHPRIVVYGELPDQLSDYLSQTDHNAEYEELDRPLLDTLKPNKAYQFQRFQDVLIEQTSGQALTPQAKVIAASFLAACGFVAYLLLQGDETVVRFIDRYGDYRATYARTTAAPMITEIYGVMNRAQLSAHWKFVRCEYSGGEQLVCELHPQPGARAAHLKNIGAIVKRPTQTKLVENVAHAIIALQPKSGARNDEVPMMVDRPSVVTALRDRLVQLARPQTMNILTPAKRDNWSQQGIAVSRTETGLHFVALLGRSAVDLPVYLQELTIEREGGEYTVASTLQAYGGN